MAITPEELSKSKLIDYNLDTIENKVDEQIKKNHGLYNWEEAILDVEYPVQVRDTIAKRYIAAGWNVVYHQTSRENGERPGLTVFTLSQQPVKHFENERWHKMQSKTEETAMSYNEAVKQIKSQLCTNCGVFLGGGECIDNCHTIQYINALKQNTDLQTVICISERKNVPGQIKVGQHYKVDLLSAQGDREGDWYANIYDMNKVKIGKLNMKHFRSN